MLNSSGEVDLLLLKLKTKPCLPAQADDCCSSAWRGAELQLGSVSLKRYADIWSNSANSVPLSMEGMHWNMEKVRATVATFPKVTHLGKEGFQVQT